MALLEEILLYPVWHTVEIIITRFYILTTVHPLFILWRSRWACAQKSMQAVTPPKGRPGWLPRRQSEASFSNLVWLCQDTGAILLYRGDKSVANPCSRSSTSSSYKQPHATLLVWIHDPDRGRIDVQLPQIRGGCF